MENTCIKLLFVKPLSASVYLKYDCQHAFCNAHLLGELIFLWEEQNQAWAKNMIDHLIVIEDTVENARIADVQSLPEKLQEQFQNHYFLILDQGYQQNPLPKPTSGKKPRGRPKQTKARNLLDRFRNHADSILAFMRDFQIPFDNNLPERDLRMMKLRQKISGTFRSLKALKAFCRIRSYIQSKTPWFIGHFLTDQIGHGLGAVLAVSLQIDTTVLPP